MKDAALVRRVIAALAEDGFEFTLEGGGGVFRGCVEASGLQVGLSLTYRDLEFSAPPLVRVRNAGDLPRPVVPHLEEDGTLCVVDSRRFVADRYSAAAQARGVVEKAKSVLVDGLTRHATAEIAREFPATWGGSTSGVAFGNYEGPIFLDADAGGFSVVRSSGNGKAKPAGFAFVTPVELSFSEEQARPNTLGEVLAWANFWDAELAARITKRINAAAPEGAPLYLITAPNGIVMFRLSGLPLPRSLDAAMKRPGAWARFLSTAHGRNLPIVRLQGRRADLGYALGRNGKDVPPLSGRTILLIGCGAIGGFLSRGLVQLGAGSGGGQLILADGDRLASWNVGRHVLGMEAVGLNKAEACRDALLRGFPGVAVTARAAEIQTSPSLFERADLCINATGEEAVGDMLNDWALRLDDEEGGTPALFHSWIEGEGAAAFSFYSTDKEFGCFRCLHPVHGEPGRYTTLIGQPPELLGGCGEGAFMPYGPAAPMAAASLVAQHSVDWAAGNPRPLLRTFRLDFRNTREVKPSNPPASDRCPACSRAK